MTNAVSTAKTAMNILRRKINERFRGLDPLHSNEMEPCISWYKSKVGRRFLPSSGVLYRLPFRDYTSCGSDNGVVWDPNHTSTHPTELLQISRQAALLCSSLSMGCGRPSLKRSTTFQDTCLPYRRWHDISRRSRWVLAMCAGKAAARRANPTPHNYIRAARSWLIRLR